MSCNATLRERERERERYIYTFFFLRSFSAHAPCSSAVLALEHIGSFVEWLPPCHIAVGAPDWPAMPPRYPQQRLALHTWQKTYPCRQSAWVGCQSTLGIQCWFQQGCCAIGWILSLAEFFKVHSWRTQCHHCLPKSRQPPAAQLPAG